MLSIYLPWAISQFGEKRRHLALDETSYFSGKLQVVARVRDVPFDQAPRETFRHMALNLASHGHHNVHLRDGDLSFAKTRSASQGTSVAPLNNVNAGLLTH